jgi:hypothetical protein
MANQISRKSLTFQTTWSSELYVISPHYRHWRFNIQTNPPSKRHVYNEASSLLQNWPSDYINEAGAVTRATSSTASAAVKPDTVAIIYQVYVQ